jgi:hypothetical protein
MRQDISLLIRVIDRQASNRNYATNNSGSSNTGKLANEMLLKILEKAEPNKKRENTAGTSCD